MHNTIEVFLEPFELNYDRKTNFMHYTGIIPGLVTYMYDYEYDSTANPFCNENRSSLCSFSHRENYTGKPLFWLCTGSVGDCCEGKLDTLLLLKTPGCIWDPTGSPLGL